MCVIVYMCIFEYRGNRNKKKLFESFKFFEQSEMWCDASMEFSYNILCEYICVCVCECTFVCGYDVKI